MGHSWQTHPNTSLQPQVLHAAPSHQHSCSLLASAGSSLLPAAPVSCCCWFAAP